MRFASETLGVTLWRKQQEVLEAVRDERRVAVKSGNGLGKDFTAAVAVLWYLQRHDPAIVLSTAPTFRQVRHVLWRQIHALYRRAAETLGGRMLDTRWELAEDRYALGLSANDADQFQGFHSENMFVVVDEAEGVDEEIYEAVEAVMTSANPRLLLIGNPTTTSGGFHRAFHRERGIYTTITISALDSPNVAQGSIEIPGLTTAAWVEERRAMWGEDSQLFRARVLGEFPDRGDDNLIAVPDIEAACLPSHPDPVGARHASPLRSAGDGPLVIGVDVARFGPDRSVVLVRRGNVVEDIRTYYQIDTADLTGRLANAYHELRPDRINVDEVGMGVSV
ncbi:MAG: AAA family ATPase, partial [Dehalococcoidia bacterium]|nr:AAA family ATPase [Dehalococcoidia bacterium]